MNERLDIVLRHALVPADEPDSELNRTIADRIRKSDGSPIIPRKRLWVAAAVAALALCSGSVTAYAAWKFLMPGAVADRMRDTKLADAFLSGEAAAVNETQSYGSYNVTLLGMVSGEMLSDYPRYGEGGIRSDRTYAVVAIENADGTPMPDTSEETYGELAFFASPLIGGYDPALYNLAALSGGYTEMTEEGILYRITECDNVEIFADHGLYLCVSEGSFYNKEAYRYDEETGEIRRNEEYAGLNALFELPGDPSAADPEKAAEYMSNLRVESDISKEKLYVELEESFAVKGTDTNGQGAEVAEYALQFVGNPYVWGGDSLTEGADCSGFTKSVYAHFAISLPHNSAEQRELGTEVQGLENAEPGDLVFYETPAHVAIYIGDGLIVHAMPQYGICVSEADFDEILTVRRIFS
ncbi:MAG: C40 family peptidase [Clostridium sp.]|nr:C40 family peptidase [Acetatifactor muris]MCM1526380.1 C40 family peptidase [Bacteroides sp.]MCM1563257.1 C40 family peptidase [Clostridium sp.]